jgi:hypothetical protein
MAQVRDPDGFARLRALADAEPAASQGDAKIAATRTGIDPPWLRDAVKR